VSVVRGLIGELGTVCAGLPDRRKGPRGSDDYSMADIGLSAFSLFFMGSPSFLAHQRSLQHGQGRSNCQTLFGMSAIPSDNYSRLMLDGTSPTAFDPLFWRAIDAAGPNAGMFVWWYLMKLFAPRACEVAAKRAIADHGCV
jgi:hypothetical protein